MLCREYFIYRKRSEGDERRVYRDCPQRCPKNKVKEYDVFRTDLCKECPKRTDLERLKRAVEEKWVVWMGPELGESLKFQKYMNALGQVQMVRRYDRDDRPVKASLLVDVYDTEKSFFDDDNRGQ